MSHNGRFCGPGSQMLKTALETNLLVDDHEAFLTISTHFFFQLDYFHHAIFDELSLGLHQLVSLACALVEEPRVHFSVKAHREYEHRFTEITQSIVMNTSDAYVFSYSKETLQVRIKASSTLFIMSGCLAP